MPSPSRRAILAAAAPAIVATLGGAAAHAEIAVDPTLGAIAKWREARARVEQAAAAFDAADESYRAQKPSPNYVELVAEQHFTLETFDRDPLAHIRSAAFIAGKRAELEAIIAARAEVDRRTGCAAARAAYSSALDAKALAEESLLDAAPTTHAGAVALLQAVAEIAEDQYRDDEDCPRIAETIRRAVEVLQGKA